MFPFQVTCTFQKRWRQLFWQFVALVEDVNAQTETSSHIDRKFNHVVSAAVDTTKISASLLFVRFAAQGGLMRKCPQKVVHGKCRR
eukprot:scaffold20875_cov33-Prasinocladus_malaysianus.AAC.1